MGSMRLVPEGIASGAVYLIAGCGREKDVVGWLPQDLAAQVKDWVARWTELNTLCKTQKIPVYAEEYEEWRELAYTLSHDVLQHPEFVSVTVDGSESLSTPLDLLLVSCDSIVWNKYL
jgi:hypothetical protein